MTQFDPTIKHPDYIAFAPSWSLMRDTVAGEDDVKARGTAYLPLKSGTAAINDPSKRQQVYNLYRLRAEFPEIVAPTIRGAVGVMLAKIANIQLPAAMEHLRERATLDGLTLEALHRRMAMEVMTTGRYGILPGIADDGTPHLSGYVAESIVNWDSTGGKLDFLVLDETALVRDRVSGQWAAVEKYRECFIENGAYRARVWTKVSDTWSAEDGPPALTPRGDGLGELPFVPVGSLDLSIAPDDVPLYGLAKLAIRVYRLDADFSFSLHMTSEPTPVAIGFDDPERAIEDGIAPKTLGSSVLWILPQGGDAKYLEFSGPGLEKQAAAIKDALDRAAQFGAQVIQAGNQAESGEALKLRAASQTATLTTIAQTTAAGLERALRHIATWIGANPEEVVVTPNLDFFGRRIAADEARAIWEGWQQGMYDWRTALDLLRQGKWVNEDADPDEIEAALSKDGGDDLAGLGPQLFGAESAAI